MFLLFDQTPESSSILSSAQKPLDRSHTVTGANTGNRIQFLCPFFVLCCVFHRGLHSKSVCYPNLWLFQQSTFSWFPPRAPCAPEATAGGLFALVGLRGCKEGCCCWHPWHSLGVTPELCAVHRALQGLSHWQFPFPKALQPSWLWGACLALHLSSAGSPVPGWAWEAGQEVGPPLLFPGMLRAGASLLAQGRAGSCSALTLWSVLEGRAAHLAICRILLQAKKSCNST